MTPEEFTSQLRNFAGNRMTLTPPLLFNNVSARVFPLRASLDTLQQLVDGYLNIAPPEAGYFRVPAPYAQLVILDYSRMGAAAQNSGWFSQMEFYFSVYLEWYKRVRGQYAFHDWAVITPYIFVTDDISVLIGRMVYGFNKIQSELKALANPWIKNPVARTDLARIATQIFPQAYAGARLETKVFLEVERDNLSNVRVPFDMGSPATPWTIARNLAEAIGGFGRDAIWLAQSMRISPINPFSHPALLPQIFAHMAPWFAPGGRGFMTNTMNLKQFRSGEKPEKVCYQALTNGPLQTTAVNGAGLLGEDRILLGDLSGGYRISLKAHSSLPIVRTLGLETHGSARIDSDLDVVELRPVMPYWLDVDMKYSSGSAIAWRTEKGIWRDETGAEYPAAAEPEPGFNASVATAIEAIAGPFRFNGTTIRVIPLLADKATLQKYLDKNLNQTLEDPIKVEMGSVHHTPPAASEQVRFEVWARPPQAVNEGKPIGGNFAYVYMAASSFSGVISKNDNVGDWAKYELAFLIPVNWQLKKGEGDWETMGVGLVPAFVFVDNCITAISRMEIQGIAAVTADFVRPESQWLSEEELTNPAQALLLVSSEVLPLAASQLATTQPLVEITSGDPNRGLGDPPDTAWRWAEVLRQELGTKKGTKQQYFDQMKIARALAIELLGSETPVSLYTLKQFRDAADANKACYQSLVRITRQLSEVEDVREIEETLTVRIYDYPGMNIVESLGIWATPLADTTAGIGYSTQGIRPFYIRACVEEKSERLLSRSGIENWKLHKAAFQTKLSERKGSPIIVDRQAESLQDQADPSRTAEIMYQARNRWQTNGNRSDISKRQATDALHFIDPQIVIESILSREWSNFDSNARWRKGHAQLLNGLAALPQGGDLKHFAEADLYRQINNQMAARPGSVAARIPFGYLLGPGVWARQQHDKLLEIRQNLKGEGAADRWQDTMWTVIWQQTLFAASRVSLEDDVNVLAPAAILGFSGVARISETLNMPPPDPAAYVKKGEELLKTIEEILTTKVEGEPSPEHNLDTVALAEQFRLGELLEVLKAEVSEESRQGDPRESQLEVMKAHSTEEGDILTLARSRCGEQFASLVNKLSRAFQKPDFCLLRDAFRLEDRDRLLPQALSWDPQWYYGNRIVLNENLVDGLLSHLNELKERDETAPRPAGSPPAAGSAPPAPSAPAKAEPA